LLPLRTLDISEDLADSIPQRAARGPRVGRLILFAVGKEHVPP